MTEKPRTPAAKPEDIKKANEDGRDNSTSTDPNVRATTENTTTTERGGIASHRDELPEDRPGFHCGYCGSPVGPEGQHWNAKGEAEPGLHAGVLVVADNWPENQDTQDKNKREDEQAQRDETNGVTEK